MNENGSSLTGLPVIDNWVLDVGWVCWESSLPPATSESNYFIQLSFKEIFGGEVIHIYFVVFDSPVSIRIAFEIPKLGVRRKR